MKLIQLNLERIFDLCRKHRVKTLAVLMYDIYNAEYQQISII